MKEFNQILTRLTAIILPLFLLNGSVFNQVPDKFNYQAVLRDAQGVARTNYAANILVSIVQGSTDGSAIYSETHSVTSNALGLINLEIGSLNPANFSNIDWSNGPYFIKVNVNGTEMGTTQLLSVPYALYAKTAESVNNAGVSGNESAFNNWDKNVSDDFSGSYNDLSNKPTIPAPVAGTESVFNVWDKNAADDFSGNYDDLTNKPPTIPDNSVTSSKIADGAIQTEDIADNSIRSHKILDGSITAADIADEPAIKQTIGDNWEDIPSSNTTLASINITAPATGSLLVIATGTLELEKSASVNASWGLDLHTAANECPGVIPMSESRSAARGSFLSSWIFASMGIPFCIQEVFSVTKGQAYIFYLNGRATGFSGAWVFHPTIVAIFIPGSM